jgi:fused signal recognition particle receptor
MDNTVVVAILVALAIVAFFALRRKAPAVEAAEVAPPQPGPPPKVEAAGAPSSPAPLPSPPPPAEPPPARAEPSPPAEAPAQAPVREAEPHVAREVAPSVAAPEPAPEPVVASASKPRRDVAAVRTGLAKARGEQGFFGRLVGLVAGKREIDPSIADRLEEVLLTSDVGTKATSEILGRIREGLRRNELRDADAVWDALRAEATRILAIGGGAIETKRRPTVVLMVGVNGVGKTTTIGKLASKLRADGKTVLLAAGDTFRAAAVQQLEVWAERTGCEVVKGKEGADPAAVAFEAVQRAQSEGIDVVLIDTAGRLQTKAPLMDELRKIVRTVDILPCPAAANAAKSCSPTRCAAASCIGPASIGCQI